MATRQGSNSITSSYTSVRATLYSFLLGPVASGTFIERSINDHYRRSRVKNSLVSRMFAAAAAAAAAVHHFLLSILFFSLLECDGALLRAFEHCRVIHYSTIFAYIVIDSIDCNHIPIY